MVEAAYTINLVEGIFESMEGGCLSIIGAGVVGVDGENL